MSNIPKLRFKEFRGKWEKSPLGHYFSFKNGINATKEQYGKGYKFINVLDIINNNIITHEKIIGSVDVSESIFNKNIVEYGDILFQRSSEVREEAGQSNVYLDKEKPATFGGFVIRGKAKRKYYPEFVHYMLKTNIARKEITTKSNGSTRYNVGQETLSEVNIYIPSISEQQKIASFLTSVDKKIELLTQKEKLLKDYKKGIMQKIFSQEIRFKADNGSEFPDWVETTVKSFMVERNIKKPKSLEYPLMSFVAYKGVIEKGDRYNREFLVNDGDNKKYKQTEYGDFIYSSNNLETGSIGLNKYGSATISPVYSIFQIKDSCNYEFVSTLLVSRSFICKMVKFRQGVVYGQWRIHESDFLKIKVRLPCLEEQTKIANFLSAIDSKIEQVTKQLEYTKEFKKGLLQQMFV